MRNRKKLSIIAIALAALLGLSGCSQADIDDVSSVIEEVISEFTTAEEASGTSDGTDATGEDADDAQTDESGDEDSQDADSSGESDAEKDAQKDAEKGTENDAGKESTSVNEEGGTSSAEEGTTASQIEEDTTESTSAVSEPCYQTINSAITNDALYFLYYAQLSAREQSIYNRISEAISKRQAKVSLNNYTDVTTDMISRVMDAIYYDQPQYFWYGGAYTVGTDATKKQVSFVQPTYVYTSGVDTMVKKLDAVANKVIAATSGMSTYEKEKYVHDYICEHTTYEEGAHDQCAYQDLVNETAVCTGYARGYQYLMLREGIPCYTCVGTGTDSTGKTDTHAWNIAVVDGAYYYVDTTWDDQETYQYVSHKYFNLDASTFLASHKASYSFYPKGNSSKYSVESVYGMSRATYDLINYSGCTTVINSVEEYVAQILPLIAASVNTEFDFVYICSSAVLETITNYKNSSQFTTDIRNRLGNETAFSFSAQTSNMTFESTAYLVTDTILLKSN